MFYVFVTTGVTATSRGVTTCHGSYSHEFGAYAKKSRLKKASPYLDIEIVRRT